MINYNNFIFDDFKNQISIISENPIEFKKIIPSIIGYRFSNDIETQHKLRIRLPWLNIEKCNKTKFDISYFELERRLKNSDLYKEKFIILCVGIDNPIFKIDLNTFLRNIEDFFYASGTSGYYGFTENGKYLIEFTDDEFETIYSNFEF
jgi:hypothetical protein